MKKPKLSDSQIIGVLKQAEGGTPVPELCREHGISSATFYKWRAKYGGMDTALMARLKELEEVLLSTVGPSIVKPAISHIRCPSAALL